MSCWLCCQGSKLGGNEVVVNEVGKTPKFPVDEFLVNELGDVDARLPTASTEQVGLTSSGDVLGAQSGPVEGNMSCVVSGEAPGNSVCESTALVNESDAVVDVRKIACDAEVAATRLMRDLQVLEAEAVLARALQQLGAHEGSNEAIVQLRSSKVFSAVMGRVQQYDSLGIVLTPTGFRLAWDKDGQQLWLNSQPGATWFEFKLMCDVDATLTQCMVFANELDLVRKYEPLLAEEPVFLGETHPLLLVTRSVISLFAFRVELMFEVLRFCNKDFGFCAECIRSAFPHEDRPIPKKHWRDVRVSIDTKNIWVPRGGGRSGTAVVQQTRVEAGFRISDWILKTFAAKIATALVENMKKSATRVADPKGPYPERMENDTLGFYRQLAEVEAAAARRPPITVQDLASRQSIFSRPLRLATDLGQS